KTPSAHRQSQSWFEHGTVKKTYQALSLAAPGEMPGDWREWHSLLAKGKRRTYEAEYGKPSTTRARVIAKEGEFWRWELMPVTGRPHQLRFEMAKHGFPILGDHLYGGSDAEAARAPTSEAIALRAVHLNFEEISPSERFGLPASVEVP